MAAFLGVRRVSAVSSVPVLTAFAKQCGDLLGFECDRVECLGGQGDRFELVFASVRVGQGPGKVVNRGCGLRCRSGG